MKDNWKSFARRKSMLILSLKFTLTCVTYVSDCFWRHIRGWVNWVCLWPMAAWRLWWRMCNKCPWLYPPFILIYNNISWFLFHVCVNMHISWFLFHVVGSFSTISEKIFHIPFCSFRDPIMYWCAWKKPLTREGGKTSGETVQVTTIGSWFLYAKRHLVHRKD